MEGVNRIQLTAEFLFNWFRTNECHEGKRTCRLAAPLINHIIYMSISTSNHNLLLEIHLCKPVLISTWLCCLYYVGKNLRIALISFKKRKFWVDVKVLNILPYFQPFLLFLFCLIYKFLTHSLEWYFVCVWYWITALSFRIQLWQVSLLKVAIDMEQSLSRHPGNRFACVRHKTHKSPQKI